MTDYTVQLFHSHTKKYDQTEESTCISQPAVTQPAHCTHCSPGQQMDYDLLKQIK